MPDDDMELCWIDLETTGLDPDRDEILEVAMVLTRGPELGRVFSRSWVVKPTNALTMDSVVLEMHAKNGLLAELRTGCSLVEVELEMIDVMLQIGFRKPMLAGSSVGFDRSFLKVHMPEFAGLLHYRNYDVRTLRTFYKSLVGCDVVQEAASSGVAHRAMADIDVAIEAARTIREQVEAWREREAPGF